MDLLMDQTKSQCPSSSLMLACAQSVDNVDASSMLMDVKSNIQESFLSRPDSIMDQKGSSQYGYQQQSQQDGVMRVNSLLADVDATVDGDPVNPSGLIQLTDSSLDQVNTADMSSKGQDERCLIDTANLSYRNPTPERDKNMFRAQQDWSISDQIQNHYGNKSCSSAGSSEGFHGVGQGGQDDSDVQLMSAEVNRKCLVCGDEATGMYFGALVCVPCKTFFLRYAGDNFSFVCKHNKKCEITVSTRTQCKYCRYQKCLQVGMCRRERPAKVELLEGQQLCVVCQDVANGVHFGAITCEGCKKFFRRGLTEHGSYTCKLNQRCEINPRTRNSCRYCRYQKCLAAGMSREAIQMGRPSKFKPMNVSSQSTPPTSEPKSEASSASFQFMYQTPKAGDQTALKRSLSVNTDDGISVKMIKTEPLSPVDSFRHSPQMPILTSPGLTMSPSTSGMSQTSEGMANVLKSLSPNQGYMDMQQASSIKVLDVTHLSPSMVSLDPSIDASNSLMELSSQNQQQLLSSLGSALMSTVIPEAQSMDMTPPSQESQPSPAPPTTTLPSATSTQLPRQVTASQPSTVMVMGSSGSLANVTQSQYTSSHPGVLSGGTATSFTPAYVQDNKKYITNVHVYSAFVKGALDNQVRLKTKSKRSGSRASSSRAPSSASTSSRIEMAAVDDFFDTDPTLKDRTPTLNALTTSGSLSSLKAVAGTSFPSEPSTPALSSPSSPSHLDLPEIGDLGSIGNITGANKSETVDFILFHQLDDCKDSLASPLSDQPQPSASPVVMAASHVPSVSSGSSHVAVPSSSATGADDGASVSQAQTVGSASAVSVNKVVKPAPAGAVDVPAQATSQASPVNSAGVLSDITYSQSHFSPVLSQKSPAEVNNKSPGSSSSTSCSSSSSQFGDNGSVYDYVMELSKQVDLVKRRDDSDSEGSEKDNSTRDLLSQDTPNLNFKNFEEYWLKNIMPDENIMWTEEHQRNICQINKVYQHFVETGTKINKKLRRELDNWMRVHEGQSKASPAWINEKVVPIYTLMSVTYCRNLPGFVEFNKHDQSTIIKLGQSQSRILVAARHWFDCDLNDFRDFMSWRGAKAGTGDEFKKKLISYAKKVQDAELDDIEAALLNVLVLIATDYPELQKPEIIDRYRAVVMNDFRAYTTAKYGTPNNRMEQLFGLIPMLRELGLQHHRMTFHMRSVRTSSSSSNT